MKTYLIRSQDGIPQSSSIVVSLSEPIVHRCVILSSFVVPNTIYNIALSLENNSFIINDGTNHTISIPDGAYNITTLLSTIKSLVSTQTKITKFNILYDSTTFLITFLGTTPFSLNFSISKFYQVIGFISKVYPSNTSFTGSYAINLLQFDNLYLYIKEFGNHIVSTNPITKATFIIPVTVNSGDVIFYFTEPNSKQLIHVKKTPIRHLTISLLNALAQPINLHGSNYEFTLNV